MILSRRLRLLALPLAFAAAGRCGLAATVTGRLVDDATGQPVAGRLYIRDGSGRAFFATNATPEAKVFVYDRRNAAHTNSVESYTEVPAAPFHVVLPPGRYRFSSERGKEWLPAGTEVEIAGADTNLTLRLHRWVDMAARGWFSGDIHTHRPAPDLPAGLLAEDLNVALPMTWWTVTDSIPPASSPQSQKSGLPDAAVIVDPHHVILPRNTEYEIFTTAGQKHTLGALLILNHQSAFDIPVFPLTRVADRARAEGALLDLDKHNWPWSLALVPVVKPDLFELANNHHWRTEFGIRNWAEPAPAGMGIGPGTDTEEHWTRYGFQTWYALLNCGFRLRPSAGTAHGVHPVPLGFSRTYVWLDGAFSAPAWLKGLNAGRSFVTTGPMLLAEVDGEKPGARFELAEGRRRKVRVRGDVFSERLVSAIEIIVNGRVAHRFNRWSRTEPPLVSGRLDGGGHRARFDHTLEVEKSSWVAVRCWEEREGGRSRFAHTAAWFFDVPGQPARPRRDESSWILDQVRAEHTRSAKLLPPAALREYDEALRAWERIAASAGE